MSKASEANHDCLARYGPLTVNELADYRGKWPTTIRAALFNGRIESAKVTRVNYEKTHKNLIYLSKHAGRARARKELFEKASSPSRILTALESGPKLTAHLSGLAAMPLSTIFMIYPALIEEGKIGCLPVHRSGHSPQNLYYLRAHTSRAKRIKREIEKGDLTPLENELFSRLRPRPGRISQLSERTKQEEAQVQYVLRSHVRAGTVNLTFVPAREGTYGVYYLLRHTELVEARLAEHGFLMLPDKGDTKLQEYKLNFFWTRNSDWMLQNLQKKKSGGYINTSDALLPLLPHLAKTTGKRWIYLQKEIIIRTLVGHFIHRRGDPTPRLQEWGVPKRLIDRILSDIKKYR